MSNYFPLIKQNKICKLYRFWQTGFIVLRAVDNASAGRSLFKSDDSTIEKSESP